MRFAIPFVSAVAILALSVAACSDDGTTGSSSGTSGTSSGTSGTSGDTDAAATINGCLTYADKTSEQDVVIPWNLDIGLSLSRCVKVKVGTTVTFEGDFAEHPLGVLGGDTPNPLASSSDRIANPGVEGEERAPTQFTTAGSFGFVCNVHPSMRGVIQVVP